jgi:hypothetical protein
VFVAVTLQKQNSFVVPGTEFDRNRHKFGINAVRFFSPKATSMRNSSYTPINCLRNCWKCEMKASYYVILRSNIARISGYLKDLGKSDCIMTKLTTTMMTKMKNNLKTFYQKSNY